MRAAALRFTGSGSRLSGYFEPRHYIDTVIDIYQVSVNRANSAPRYAIVIDFSKLVRSQCRVRPTRGWPAARRAQAKEEQPDPRGQLPIGQVLREVRQPGKGMRLLLAAVADARRYITMKSQASLPGSAIAADHGVIASVMP